MSSRGRIIFGTLVTLTISVFITQIAFGVKYLIEPINCEHSKFLTMLTLVGGCSGILSIVFLTCCCYGYGFGLRASKPDSSGRQIFY